MRLPDPSLILNDLRSLLGEAEGSKLTNLRDFASKYDNGPDLIAEAVGRICAVEDGPQNLDGYWDGISAAENLGKVREFALHTYSDEEGEASSQSFFKDVIFGLGYASAFSGVDLSDHAYLEMAATAYWATSAEIFEGYAETLTTSAAPTV